MDEKGQITSVNRSEKTSSTDPEKTVVTPYFDAAAIKQAKPAVPLSQVRAQSTWPSSGLLIIAILAGLAGGIIGGILPMLYLKDDAAQSADSKPTTEATAKPARPSAQTASAPDAQLSSSAELSASSDAEAALASGRTDDAPQSAVTEDMETTLRGALDDWVAATNARDIDRQMSFYNRVVGSFYRMRNASLADVRADKERVFERASSIDIRAGAPDIRLSPDGLTAIMRFRKQYAIAGGGEDRRGEVVQELRWKRADGQWRIISERDLRVVR